MLNQADTPEQQAAASRVARRLLPAYRSVLVAALHSLEEKTVFPEAGVDEEDFRKFLQPRLSASEPPVLSAWETTAGIILAAGEAKRMFDPLQGDRPKQILTWRGAPLVRHVAANALEAGLSPVVVVLGAYAERVRPALDGLPVKIIENPDWQTGMSSSVIAGVRELPENSGAAVFLLADQPQIPVALIQSLVELHAATLAPIVAPQIDGRRANPALFDCSLYPDLLALAGDVGARSLFARYPATWLPWLDARIGFDVDTPEDYRRLLEM
jgi:molybdenum cofactor cytidylyltransferase